MTYVKKSHTKRYLAIILAIILIGAVGGAVYWVLSAPKVTVGVKVGDTFIYSIKGTVKLTGLEASPTAGFEQYNQTDYYKVVITGINGTRVSMDTKWRFLNGTEVNSSQTIDIANGEKTDENGFWAIYTSGLNTGDLLRPKGYDGNTVNNTYSAPYTSGNRMRCYWFITGQFQDMTDPTGSTLMYDYLYMYFDQETGMMVAMQDLRYYNNPERSETLMWTLTNSTVWDV
ncbi:MAG: hypothetical protein ACQCN4_05340 [Candidatus Bathyarchaeia archaeon]|jgi:hypothetical protein